jgi:hypothetical protein
MIAVSTWALHVRWLSFVSFSEMVCVVIGSMLRPSLLLEEGDAMDELGVTLDGSDYHVKLRGAEGTYD